MSEVLDKMKIQIIGFSVTNYGERPYPVRLAELLPEPHHTIKHIAFGGLSIDFLACIIDRILDKESEIVILEIATSFYSLIKNDLEEAVEYLVVIVEKILAKNKKILFLNLYRRDIDDIDLVVEAINKVAQYYGIHILNLKEKYRQSLISSNEDGTVDGVHPTEKTVDEISNNLAVFILNNASIRLCRNNINSVLGYSYIDLELDENVTKVSNRVKGFRYFEIYNEEEYKKAFSTNCEILGFVFLFGPESTNIKIKLNQIDGSIIEMNLNGYDENCYYRRLGYRTTVKNNSIGFVLKNAPRDPNIKLNREPWESEDKVYSKIYGFCIRKENLELKKIVREILQ